MKPKKSQILQQVQAALFWLLVSACSVRGQQSDPQWLQVGQSLDGRAASDFFGSQVSISSDGSIIAVSAPQNDDNGANSGHVLVYRNIGGSWSQMGQDLQGEAAGDRQWYAGGVLSADGMTLATGATYNDGVNGIDSGHARVFKWDETTNLWNQMGGDIDGEAAYDYSGVVDISADGLTLAVGASGNDGNGVSSGHVRVYHWDGNTWVQQGADIDGEVTKDYAGDHVSISADASTVVVGAYFATNGAGLVAAGQVRVYRWIANQWQKVGQSIEGDHQAEYAGRPAVSSNGNIVAVGSYGYEGVDGSLSQSGRLRVFQWDEGSSSWMQMGQTILGMAAGDMLGGWLALSADGLTLAIGARSVDIEGKTDTGQVTVYRWDQASSLWVQFGQTIDGEAPGDFTGHGVDISSDGYSLIVGAFKYDSVNGIDSGRARVFHIDAEISPGEPGDV